MRNFIKKNKYLLTLSAGHFFTDMSQGALPAMLPFYIAAGGMNYAQAAGIKFAISLSSSVTQPVFGFLADKLSRFWLLPVGILLSGFGLAMLGFFPNYYWIMFGFAMLSGIGVAAYHPEGARLANSLAGKKKACSMSIFTVGGTFGMATGPLVVTPALLFMGLTGGAVLLIPAIIMCAILFFVYPRIRSQIVTKETEEKKITGERENEWLKFLWLSVAIIARSTINHSLNLFIPLYWVDVLHQSKAAGGMVISFMIFIGAIANIVGGQLADRFGLFKIIRLGWIILIPSIFFMTYITNPLLALLMLVPVSTGQFFVTASTIVLGQKYLPKNMGVASGVTLGLGVSIGGLITPLIGGYADIHGLTAALRLLSFLPVLGAIVAFTCRPPAVDA